MDSRNGMKFMMPRIEFRWVGDGFGATSVFKKKEKGNICSSSQAGVSEYFFVFGVRVEIDHE